MTSLTFLLSLAPSDLMLGEMLRMCDESDFYVGQELSGQFLSGSRIVLVEKCPPPVEKCLPVEKCPGQEMSVRKWGSKSVRSRIGLTRIRQGAAKSGSFELQISFIQQSFVLDQPGRMHVITREWFEQNLP